MVGIDGLADVIVHASIQALFTIGSHGVGGHCNDGQVPQARIRPDLSSSLNPVHHGHLHIHQHDVVVVLPRHSDGNLAILCQINLNRGIL